MCSLSVLFGLGMPGPTGMIIIGIIAILLFGNRLPEVARSLGKGLAEFKKGIKGVEDEIHSTVNKEVNSTPAISETPSAAAQHREEATAPKFEPPTSEPQTAEAAQPQTAAGTATKTA
jgi:sec-independent protein translocase protein TatA